MPLKKEKPSTYDQIAGQNIQRLAALSDSIFAVAMTLLVLDLHVPAIEGIHSERDLWKSLIGLAPQIGMVTMSFLTLGIFWMGQQTQLNHYAKADRNVGWLHIAILFTICFMPFSTKFLGEFITYRTALIVYWLNILVYGLLSYASWLYAARQKLFKPGSSPNVHVAIRRRIITAQSLYAVGAALCLVSTYWSIGFILLVQLNYAIAPVHWLKKT